MLELPAHRTLTEKALQEKLEIDTDSPQQLWNFLTLVLCIRLCSFTPVCLRQRSPVEASLFIC